MSVLNKLTEGIVNRDLQSEGAALLEKWDNTGLLEGIGSDREKQTMACLLENQAKELLREASSMGAGDVEGFAAVAFPIVRRVFGGLVANDIVSVQPMSLPSGLIFFLDFQVASSPGGLTFETNDSLYGGGVVGQQITGGVNLTYASQDQLGALARNDGLDEGFYNLNNGFSSPTGSATVGAENVLAYASSGSADAGIANIDIQDSDINNLYADASSADKAKMLAVLQHDPDVLGLGAGHQALVVRFPKSLLSGSTAAANMVLNEDNLIALEWDAGTAADDEPLMVRRLTALGSSSHHPTHSSWNGTKTHVYMVLLGKDADISGMGSATATTAHGAAVITAGSNVVINFPMKDDFEGSPAAGTSNALGAVVGQSQWGLENNPDIPEIDIKVDSVSVTAMTKKLKAKWTPELGQDLNAYHNLDAEVELTSILSEQIALEIDREILNDLVKGAKAGTLYWSRRPGKFTNRATGAPISTLANESLLGADFTGTVSEWYETLVETINDVSAQIHRKTLRGGANFVVVSPEVANILEFTSGFRADVTGDTDRGTVGAVKSGALSKKWDVYVDPYFTRNLVLVGRKGGSFLESGYVYAPYVPLQVTPTIFGVEDFVPRKGVMTRYAKKMVRPDMYGLVVVTDLNG